LLDRLITIESQTRVHGTCGKVLQSNLDQLEEKLNAIRKSLPTKNSESKVRFSGWSTSQRGSCSQSEGLTSEGSSPSASGTTHKGHFWQKRKSWRNIPQPHKEEKETKDPKVDTRPNWVSGGSDYRFGLVTWWPLAPSIRRTWWLQAPSENVGFAEGKSLFPLSVSSRQSSAQS